MIILTRKKITFTVKDILNIFKKTIILVVTMETAQIAGGSY